MSASLKVGGAPEIIGALLEGESLFNDASGILLYEIFLGILLKQQAEKGDKEGAQAAPATHTDERKGSGFAMAAGSVIEWVLSAGASVGSRVWGGGEETMTEAGYQWGVASDFELGKHHSHDHPDGGGGAVQWAAVVDKVRGAVQ